MQIYEKTLSMMTPATAGRRSYNCLSQVFVISHILGVERSCLKSSRIKNSLSRTLLELQVHAKKAPNAYFAPG